ncbi:hypothetical protein C8F01DRAFT_1091327 [Mycena amicta]|nr:hypothetical protein C8F01DRAFT_1091327 [Mycena amicta]
MLLALGEPFVQRPMCPYSLTLLPALSYLIEAIVGCYTGRAARRSRAQDTEDSNNVAIPRFPLYAPAGGPAVYIYNPILLASFNNNRHIDHVTGPVYANHTPSTHTAHSSTNSVNPVRR